MIKSPFTKAQRKQAKLSHRNDKKLNSDWFQAKRIDLGSQIINSQTPPWGSFNFMFTKTGI